MSWIVLHYKEIGIKGKNRPYFERTLMRNIAQVLGEGSKVRRFHGRLMAAAPPGMSREETDRRLCCVAGVGNFAHAEVADLRLEHMTEVALRMVKSQRAETFKVFTRRSNKRFQHTSVEVNTAIGKACCEATGMTVKLNGPELTVYVEVTEREALIYTQKIRGQGGLPVGIGGRVVCLLSGGIDSPVAAQQMMRRGSRAILLHFHNYTRDAVGVRTKLIELARVLNRYQLGTRLYMIPFGDLQEALIAAVRPELRMLAYRRAMFKVGARVLQRERAEAYVTGDSLGQVASQTLTNISVIYDAANAPVLSPLITQDKETIVERARDIGTYDISIRPYDDCCSFLIAKHPDTHARLQSVTACEARIPLEELAESAMQSAELIDFPAVYDAAPPISEELGEKTTADSLYGATQEIQRDGSTKSS